MLRLSYDGKKVEANKKKFGLAISVTSILKNINENHFFRSVLTFATFKIDNFLLTSEPSRSANIRRTRTHTWRFIIRLYTSKLTKMFSLPIKFLVFNNKKKLAFYLENTRHTIPFHRGK